MAIRSESRVTIASSVPEVWAYVCDVGRWPEWAPTVRECRVGGGAPLEPGSRVEQRAKGIFGSTRNRAQHVTAVEAPRRLAFAGPMGTSAARWGMELEPTGDGQTDAKMWVEVDLKSLMRAIPGRLLNGSRDGGDQGCGRVRYAGRLGFLAGVGAVAHPLKAHGQ